MFTISFYSISFVYISVLKVYGIVYGSLMCSNACTSTHAVLHKRIQIHLSHKVQLAGKWKTDFQVKVNFVLLYQTRITFCPCIFPALSNQVWFEFWRSFWRNCWRESVRLIHLSQLCLIIEHQNRNKTQFISVPSIVHACCV